MGLKDLEIRVKLPWKEDRTEANRLYAQIIRAQDPERAAREINQELKRRR